MLNCFCCKTANSITTYKCSNCSGSLARERLSHFDRLFEEIEKEKLSGYNAFRKYMWIESRGKSDEYAAIAHTLANLQLQDICASISRKAISIETFRDLLEELEIVTDRAKNLLSVSFSDPVITVHAARIIQALAQFREMVSMAFDYEKELDSGVLEYSLSMAMEADEAIHAECLAIEKKTH